MSGPLFAERKPATIHRLTVVLTIGVTIGAAACLSPLSVAQQVETDVVPNEPEIAFARMDTDRVRTEVLSWLASAGQNADSLKETAARWADGDVLSRLTGEQLLDRVALRDQPTDLFDPRERAIEVELRRIEDQVFGRHGQTSDSQRA